MKSLIWYDIIVVSGMSIRQSLRFFVTNLIDNTVDVPLRVSVSFSFKYTVWNSMLDFNSNSVRNGNYTELQKNLILKELVK